MPTQSDVISAVHGGDIEKIKSLLHADSSLAASRDERSVSALMHAYYRGRKDIAELFLNSRSDLDIFETIVAARADSVTAILARDPGQATNWSGDGFTPLHFAAFFNQPAIARELSGSGADAGAVSMNPMEVTPLHSAAAARATEIVRLLVEHGAPVNAKQHGGWTALHAAWKPLDLDAAGRLFVLAQREHLPCPRSADRQTVPLPRGLGAGGCD